MGSLRTNNLTSSRSLLGRWKGKPVIYVEGESDKKIFENYWFIERLDKVRFDTAPKGEGCAAVVAAVTNDRTNGIEAFGIVDRDKLMADRQWGLLYQTDDAVFEASQPHNNVKVTLRWELESYLVEPEVVEAYLAPAQGGRAIRPKQVVVAELLDHADALIPFAALNHALHKHGKTARGDGYTENKTRQEVHSRIVDDHSAKPFPGPIWNDFQANIPIVDGFSGPQAITPEEKLVKLLRAVNGKAMLERIKKASGIQNDITYHLAKEVKQVSVPAEIDNFIKKCCL